MQGLASAWPTAVRAAEGELVKLAHVSSVTASKAWGALTSLELHRCSPVSAD
jgi:hypothetical protein